MKHPKFSTDSYTVRQKHQARTLTVQFRYLPRRVAIDFCRHRPFVLKFCEADDLEAIAAAELYPCALRYRDDYVTERTGKVVPFKTFAYASLYKILLRQAIPSSAKRHLEREASLRQCSISEYPYLAWRDDRESANELNSVIWEYVDRLKPRIASMIMARFADGLTYDAVGERFGVTKERVRQLLTRAYEDLRLLIRQEDVCPRKNSSAPTAASLISSPD